jgi:hypothetical protein
VLGLGRSMRAISAPTMSSRIAPARPTASSSRALSERPVSPGLSTDPDFAAGWTTSARPVERPRTGSGLSV